MTYLLSLLPGVFTVVELNCENLFDCRHDSMKHDEQFLPFSDYCRTSRRYWQKANRTGQAILSRGESDKGWSLPDLVALCEVEDDSCLVDLTKRSLLRKARYEYVMTYSPGERGIDMVLLYSPFPFQLSQSYSTRIHLMKKMRPMCDTSYTKGHVSLRDTLHVFVVHAFSRTAGERPTCTHHRLIINRLLRSVDSLRALSVHLHALLMDDFNGYSKDENIRQLTEHGLIDVSRQAVGTHGVRGTHHYHGDWGSLDHIMVDEHTAQRLVEYHVYDVPFLLKEDEKYGGVQPRRNYLGPRYQNGFSDHLPLVARPRWDD